MGIYYVKTVVEFGGEVEADTAEEAEAKGWHWDTDLMYEGVYSIDVDVIEEDEEDSE